MLRFAKMLATHQDALVSAIVKDTGKPPLDALGGDVLVTLEHMRYYYRQAHKVLRPRRISSSWLFFRTTSFRQFYEPHGVVLIYGPSNYPLQLALVPAITALYAGNSVVAKVSERASTLTTTLRRIIGESQLPDDLLQIVNDEPELAAEYIDAHPDFLLFTGSSRNGAHVAKRAAGQLIPGIFELGGKDAAIVFSDCDLERTVEGVLYGAFSNTGQVCVGIRRVLIERSIFDELVERLCVRTSQLRIQPDIDGEYDLGPIRAAALSTLLSSHVADAIERGGQVLNNASDHTGSNPVILTKVPRDAKLLNEESFGPVICVESFNNETEAIEVANGSRFALGASIWTRDHARANRIATRLSAANIAVNDVIRNVANPAAPFGGNRASGYGRYHGVEGLVAFTRTKIVMLNRSKARSEKNWFPLNWKVYRQLSWLIRLRHIGIGSLFGCMVLVTMLFPAAASAQQSMGHLYLRVHLPSASRGEIAYLIFKSGVGFPNKKEDSIRHGFVPSSAALQKIDLGELPRGRFAVSVYLDENNNHKLDTKWLGIPKEPVGASRNPRTRMGPPKFEDSVFEMPDADLTIEIRMVQP